MAIRLSALCAAACLTLTAAANAPSDQKPIGSDEFPIVPIDPPEKTLPEWPFTKAKIVLYPASRTYPDDLEAMGKMPSSCSYTAAEDVVTMHLDTDTCLSGEYYMRDNVRTIESPACPDGSVPTLAFYQNGRCTGSPYLERGDLLNLEGPCLWSEQEVPVPSYYWSLMYRCSHNPDTPAPVVAASATILDQTEDNQVPARVRFHFGNMFPCHSDFANTSRPRTVWPDECVRPVAIWPGDVLETIEILSPAVCPDGTRAQLALYDHSEDQGLNQCNPEHLVFKESLIDVQDSMLRTCIKTTGFARRHGLTGRARGVMFRCTGVPITSEQRIHAEAIPRGPRTSHSECATSAGSWRWEDPVRPPTFMYPEPMTCVTLPKNHQVRIHDKTTCEDGSSARLGVWEESGCVGWPKRIHGVDTLNCESWNLHKETSYKLWCGPDGQNLEDRVNDDDERAIVSTDYCPPLDLKPGWKVVSRHPGPTIERLVPDEDCLKMSKAGQLRVFGNAKCPDGKTEPKLAVYGAGGCRGEPEGDFDVAELLDKCMPTCDGKHGCSMKFKCSI